MNNLYGVKMNDFEPLVDRLWDKNHVMICKQVAPWDVHALHFDLRQPVTRQIWTPLLIPTLSQIVSYE